MFKNALISVSDKTNLIEFIKPFCEKGMRVVSTGGTAKYLMDAGIKVVDISEQTEFPEILDGRVKTLHPKVHMGLLARTHLKDDMEILKQYQVEPFDLVVGNLYPFEKALSQNKTGADLIEYIDIGGPSFLRSASKNFHSITVVCDPLDYKWISDKNGDLSIEDRKKLASKIFAHTSSYDAMISEALYSQSQSYHGLGGELVQELRYGENPQQNAQWYRRRGALHGLHEAEILQGKALSYNNILDLDAATKLVSEFTEPAAVVVKHNNACGVGINNISLEKAVEYCLKADPISAFGGIVAINKPINLTCAEKLNSLFLECIIAPDFSQESLNLLSKKKNLRLLKWPQISELKKYVKNEKNMKTIVGGYLIQSNDDIENWNQDWKKIGSDPITKEVESSLNLAWKVVSSLKSNAIAIADSNQTLGLGMGQVNRVDAVAQAIERMKTHHNQALNPVLASDAFFPFPDSIELIAKAGIKWVIQPGGSVNDESVFDLALKMKVNLIITGTRHFKH